MVSWIVDEVRSGPTVKDLDRQAEPSRTENLSALQFALLIFVRVLFVCDCQPLAQLFPRQGRGQKKATIVFAYSP